MTLDHSVVAPETVGVDPHRLDVLLRRIRLEVEHGPLPSAQVAVARGGSLVAFETWGPPNRPRDTSCSPSGGRSSQAPCGS